MPGQPVARASICASHVLVQVQIAHGLCHRHAPLADQLHRLELELTVELPLLHCHPPVPKTPYLGVRETGSSSLGCGQRPSHTPFDCRYFHVWWHASFGREWHCVVSHHIHGEERLQSDPQFYNLVQLQRHRLFQRSMCKRRLIRETLALTLTRASDNWPDLKCMRPDQCRNRSNGCYKRRYKM